MMRYALGSFDMIVTSRLAYARWASQALLIMDGTILNSLRHLSICACLECDDKQAV